MALPARVGPPQYCNTVNNPLMNNPLMNNLTDSAPYKSSRRVVTMQSGRGVSYPQPIPVDVLLYAEFNGVWDYHLPVSSGPAGLSAWSIRVRRTRLLSYASLLGAEFRVRPASMHPCVIVL